MGWASVSTVISKALAICSQAVLATLLQPNDYGVFASVAAFGFIASGLQNGGLQKLVLQRRDSFHETFGACLRFSVFLGVAGALSYLIVGYFRSSESLQEGLALAIQGLAVPFAAISNVYSAAVLIGQRFRAQAAIISSVALIYQIALIAAAYFGAAGVSISIALLLSSIFGLLLSYRLTRGLGYREFSFRQALDYQPVSSVIALMVLISFLFGLTLSVDYLVLKQLAKSDDMGHYFFAFNLSQTAALFILSGMTQVFLVVFSDLKANKNKLWGEVHSKGAYVAFLMSIISILLMAFIQSGLQYFWGPKWKMAGEIAVLFFLALPFRVFASIGAVALEAAALWTTRCVVLGVEVALLAAFACLGFFYLDGIVGAAIAVAFQRGFSGFFAFVVAGAKVADRPWPAVILFGRLTLPYAVSVIVANLAVSSMERSGFANCAIYAAMALALYLLIFALLNPVSFKAIAYRVLHKFLKSNKDSRAS